MDEGFSGLEQDITEFREVVLDFGRHVSNTGDVDFRRDGLEIGARDNDLETWGMDILKRNLINPCDMESMEILKSLKFICRTG